MKRSKRTSNKDIKQIVESVKKYTNWDNWIENRWVESVCSGKPELWFGKITIPNQLDIK